ncbi:unnamed protein product [Hymenolepis diminuta]|uniref:Reverse transcriptase domain-containing protein n=1 Tax=Hymenolepis diminuta TaxID=6216 RepID=A0A158QDQ3_HYMDI|nr:unnamed protein product [Hymenolepis diminuta]
MTVLSNETGIYMLLRKFSQSDHDLYLAYLPPLSPKDLTFEETIEKCENVFGDTTSLFSRHFKCQSLDIHDGEDIHKYTAVVNRIHTFTILNGGKFFAKMDRSDDYLQIEVESERRELLTTNTHRELFQCTRLPFGIKTAPAIFQHFMDTMISRLVGHDYEIKYQRTEDFGQADSLSHFIKNQLAENEEKMVALASVKRNVQHILAESIQNTPISAEDIGKETEKDAVPEQALKDDLLKLYRRRDSIMAISFRPSWNKPDEIYSQKIRLLVGRGRGHRISRAPVRQMPASGKKSHSPKFCIMATNGNSVKQVICRFRRVQSSVSNDRSKTPDPLRIIPQLNGHIHRKGKRERRGDYGRDTAKFLAGIQINPASFHRREISGLGVNESKVENSAAEEDPTDGKRKNKNGFAINTPVYACDYRLGCQETAAIITKRHGEHDL